MDTRKDLGFLQGFASFTKHIPVPHANERLAARKLTRGHSPAQLLPVKSPTSGLGLTAAVFTERSGPGAAPQRHYLDGRQNSVWMRQHSSLSAIP